MKTMILSISLVLLAAFSVDAKTLKIGDTMPTPTQKMKSVDGKQYDLPSMMKSNKPTLVIFTCNHCPYVKKWDKRMADVGNEFHGKINVIAINSNDPEYNPLDNFEGMKKRAKKLSLKYPYVVDATSNVAREFGAEKTPEIFLFDKAGKLVYKGAPDDNYDAKKAKTPWLKNAITNLLANKKIDPAVTKAIGCSIKFREKTS